MKTLHLIAALLLTPFLLAVSSIADEVDKKKDEVISKKPTLTYYYFDG
ncbi:MAG: hypothetical protein ACI9R3_006498 [Verrucomicrobiales bacterium]